MLFSLAATAFAESMQIKADKDKIEKGQDVAVTVSLDQEVTDATMFVMHLNFDGTLFNYKDGTVVTGGTILKSVKGEGSNCYKQVNWAATSGKGTIPAGTFWTATFTAKKDIDSDSVSATFSAEVDDTQFVGLGTTTPTYAEVSLTVTITPPAPGYKVSVPERISAGVNGETIVPVAVHLTEANGDNSDNDTFNAYSFTVTYDTAKLRYKSIAPTAAEVTELGNGVLKIAGTSHTAINGSETAFQLTFETFSATGAATVTVSDAKVDDKANAIDKDAPLAKTGNLTTTVTVGGYSVTLPGGFAGNASAAAGEEYTFSVTNGKAYAVTATVDGVPVPVIKTDNGYKIAAEFVTGKIVVEATPKKMVTVNVTNNGEGIITGLTDGMTVPEGEDVTFTVTAPKKSTTPYVVTVENKEIAASNETTKGSKRDIQYVYTYTIPGSMVKGESITVTVTEASDSVALIKYGNGWDGNVTVTYTANGEEKTLAGGTIPKTTTALTITIKENAKRDYTVQWCASPAKDWVDFAGPVNKGGQLVYTKSGLDETSFEKGGCFINITYTEKPDYAADVVEEYLKLGTDGSPKTMWLVLCSGQTNGYLTCSYDGSPAAPMYYSEKYQKWAYLVISAGTVKPEVSIKNVDDSTGKLTVDYSGDVNMTGGVDINDAQLIVNMYKADYKDFTEVAMEKFLRADMNGDMTVDNADVLKIIAAVNK